MDTPRLTRRDTLKLGAFGAAVVALPLSTTLAAGVVSQYDKSKLVPYRTNFVTPPLAQPIPKGDVRRPAAWRDEDVDFYRISQMAVDANILPGVRTQVFGYDGSIPGPVVRARRNRPVVIRMKNELPTYHPVLKYETWTSCHLHGSPSKPQYDGYASDITRPRSADGKTPGEWKDYVYENRMSARTLWYHDHGVHHTAENAYMGLAAQYHCSDPDEDASLRARGIVLPSDYGWNDFPIVISDKSLAGNGQLLFDDKGHSSTFGDINTVNGTAWPVMKVEPRVYRFRLLNASLSRGYRLALSDGRPMVLVGTDAGLTQQVVHLKDFRIGMAERYEVLIDFTGLAAGKTIDLRNLGLPNTPTYDNTDKVMRFQVVAAGSLPKPAGLQSADATRPTPGSSLADGKPLSEGAPAMDFDPAMKLPMGPTRNLELTRNNGEWTVGPYTWEEVIASGYSKVFANPQAGTVEKWIVKNSSGGWFHPVHIHLVDFRVVKRNGGAPFRWEAAGGKDVVYVGENETVELLMAFHPGDRGRYMIHCHNLTHEDHDMMTQFRVGPENKDGRATFSDGEPFLTGSDPYTEDAAGTQRECDRDDPVLAAHPTSASDV